MAQASKGNEGEAHVDIHPDSSYHKTREPRHGARLDHHHAFQQVNSSHSLYDGSEVERTGNNSAPCDWPKALILDDLGVLATLATKIASDTIPDETARRPSSTRRRRPSIPVILSFFTLPRPLSSLFALSWVRECVASATIRVADVASTYHNRTRTRARDKSRDSTGLSGTYPISRCCVLFRRCGAWCGGAGCLSNACRPSAFHRRLGRCLRHTANASMF